MILARIPRAGALALLCAFVFAASSAQANVGQEYGFGSRTAGLAGAGVAWGSEGYFAYSNPAALPLLAQDTLDELYPDATPQRSHRLKISYGLIYMQPNFPQITNVTVENFYTSDKQRNDNVDVTYKHTLGQALGIGYVISPELQNLTIGLTSFLPLEQVAYFDTGETYVPEYFMYRARTQRPQVELGLGADVAYGIRAGVGLHIAYSLDSSATVFLQSGTGKSSMRFSANMKPKAVPVLALHYSDPRPSIFAAGVVLRFPVKSPNHINVNTGAHIFPNLRGLDFNFDANAALYYDPLSVETGFSLEPVSWARSYVQVDYQAWSRYEAPALQIGDVDLTNRTENSQGVIPNSGQNPTYRFRDIFVPRFGQEFLVTEMLTLRAGYAYRPSIMESLPTEAGNYLDPSKHIFTVGAGLKFQRFLSFDTPSSIDFHGSYEKLKSDHVTKSPGNEGGNAADRKIGSPGYDIGGYVIGGGVSLTVAL